MRKQDLLQAIRTCNAGTLQFNLGISRAFLYSKRWYPLRATVNYARALNGKSELTTDRALVELVYLQPYTRVSDINFTNNLPVSIGQPEAILEVKELAGILKRLT